MAKATVEGDKIVVSRARLAFPDLFVPKGFVGKDGKVGDPTYGATLLIDRDDPAFKAVIMAEEDKVAKAKWDKKAEAIMAEVRANNRGAIKPGELKASYNGYAGNDFISCTNRADSKPTTVARNGKKIETEDGTFYSGCYVLAHITLWAQDNSWGKRINANITGIQFVEDGDAFGGGAAPSSPDAFVNLSAEDPIGDMVD